MIDIDSDWLTDFDEIVEYIEKIDAQNNPRVNIERVINSFNNVLSNDQKEYLVLKYL